MNIGLRCLSAGLLILVVFGVAAAQDQVTVKVKDITTYSGVKKVSSSGISGTSGHSATPKTEGVPGTLVA